MNDTTLYGTTPWQDPAKYIKEAHEPVEKTRYQFGIDNPIFEEFFNEDNFTEERRRARIALFGEWSVERVGDSVEGINENTFMGDFGDPIRFDRDRYKLTSAEWVPDSTIDMFVRNKRVVCENEDIDAYISVVAEYLILSDFRAEQVENLSVNTSAVLPVMFRHRFWVFPSGNDQKATIYGIFAFAMSIVRREGGENVVVRTANTVTMDAKASRSWRRFREAYIKPIVEGVDPDKDTLWWSREQNPEPGRKFLLTEGGHRSFLQRVEAMVSVQARGVHIYIGSYLDGEERVELPILEKRAKVPNTHWWVTIIDSFLGICYTHNSMIGLEGKVEVFLNTINSILKKMSPEQIEYFNAIRIASPENRKEMVVKWDNAPERMGIKGYMLKEITKISRVKTRQQMNGCDCGLFSIKNILVFIDNLRNGREGTEASNLIPTGWRSAAYRRIVQLDIVANPYPEDPSLHYLDSIGSQLLAHPDRLEKAYWHIENAGAVLISFRNSDYRYRYMPGPKDTFCELPKCKPNKFGGCFCGFTAVPVPLGHKVILQSTQMANTGDKGGFTETDLSRVSAEDRRLARVAVAGKGILEADNKALYMTELNKLLRLAVKKQILATPVPRILVGVWEGGAYVISNGGSIKIDKSHEIVACGYNMRSTGAHCLGPLALGAVYPMRVNQRLWAWISKPLGGIPPLEGPAKLVVVETAKLKAAELAKSRAEAELAKLKAEEAVDGLKDPEKVEIPPIVPAVDLEDQPKSSPLTKKPFREQIKIIGKHGKKRARKHLTKRKKVEAVGFYVPTGDSDNSADDGIIHTQGLRPRKKRRTQVTQEHKRPLHEFSDSEHDSDEEFDPSGNTRVAKRVKVAASKENLDFYMRIGLVEQFAPSTLVGPNSALLEGYIKTGTMPEFTTVQEVLERAPDINLRLYFQASPDDSILMLDEPLPNEVLREGYTSVVEYLKRTDLIYTNSGKDIPVSYKVDDDDSLIFIYPPNGEEPGETGNLTIEGEFERFCDILNNHIEAEDLNPLAGIGISKWPTLCLNGLSFAFTHKKKELTVPKNLLSKTIEKGIRAFISIYVGIGVEFTLEYQHNDGPYESFETFRAPFIERAKTAKEETVNVSIKTRPTNIVALRSITRHKSTTIGGYGLEPFETYLSNFPDVKSFERYCFNKFPELVCKEPIIAYDILGVPGGFKWKLFKVAADWAAFVEGAKPGETANVSFTRQLTMDKALPPHAALGNPVEFLTAKSYGGVPPEKISHVPWARFWIYQGDILRVNHERFCGAINPNNGIAPFGYVINDAKVEVPPQSEWLWADSLDIIGKELKKVLEAVVEAPQNLRVFIVAKGNKEEDDKVRALEKKRADWIEAKRLAQNVVEKAAKDAKKAAKDAKIEADLKAAEDEEEEAEKVAADEAAKKAADEVKDEARKKAIEDITKRIEDANQEIEDARKGIKDAYEELEAANKEAVDGKKTVDGGKEVDELEGDGKKAADLKVAEDAKKAVAKEAAEKAIIAANKVIAERMAKEAKEKAEKEAEEKKAAEDKKEAEVDPEKENPDKGGFIEDEEDADVFDGLGDEFGDDLEDIVAEVELELEKAKMKIVDAEPKPLKAGEYDPDKVLDDFFEEMKDDIVKGKGKGS